jgi:hypothetical protein
VDADSCKCLLLERFSPSSLKRDSENCAVTASDCVYAIHISLSALNVACHLQENLLVANCVTDLDLTVLNNVSARLMYGSNEMKA